MAFLLLASLWDWAVWRSPWASWSGSFGSWISGISSRLLRLRPVWLLPLLLSLSIAGCDGRAPAYSPDSSSANVPIYAPIGSRFSAHYDRQIEEAVARWWPDFPFWLAWKAQLYQESRLDPNAVSPAGASGIAQFMPRTWAAIVREMGYENVDPFMADIAIEAGAYYMAQLRAGWHSPRPEGERQKLAQASYNAGFGNILRAQRLCGYPRDWAQIHPCLVQVTGRHHKETITYVERIARWWAEMAAE